MNVRSLLLASTLMLGSLVSSDTFAGRSSSSEDEPMVFRPNASLTLMREEIKPVSLLSSKQSQNQISILTKMESYGDEEISPSIAASIAASDAFPTSDRIRLLKYIPQKFTIRATIAESIIFDETIGLEWREKALTFLSEGPLKENLRVQLETQRLRDEMSDSEDDASYSESEFSDSE